RFKTNYQECDMLNAQKALSSFSVDDIQKAKDFYGKTLGLDLSAGPEGTLVLSEGKTLIYPKPNHQPATFTVLNFPVDNVEKAVDEGRQAGRPIRSLQRTKPEDGWARNFPRKTGQLLPGDPAGNILSVLEAA